MRYGAVITADVVNSTKLQPKAERRLLNALKKVLAPYQFEFFRGDSFQIYLREPTSSLRVALLCRTIAIQLSESTKETSSDVRLSIGIGKVTTPVKTLGAAKGEAFVLSGRAFDSLVESRKRLSISVNNELAQIGLDVITDYLDAIYSKMTAKQAAVIVDLLRGRSQKEVAVHLKKSISTINQLVAAGKWNAMQKLLGQYERIIQAVVSSRTRT